MPSFFGIILIEEYVRKECKDVKEVEFKNRDRFIELGLTISSLRKMKGMSQEELADKAHMSRSHLSAIEAPNVIRSFSLEMLFNIADALDVKAGDLLNHTII